MLIIDYPEWCQPSIAYILIPEFTYALTSELKQIDNLLRDETFEEVIIEKFNTQYGRPTVPVRVYLRMMFLKFYLRLSFEDLVSEVNHNLMYRFFCRIPLEQKVPDSTALMKITTRYGEEIISEINNRLLTSITNQKLVKGRKLRVDTTVVEANIDYPTDAGLLYKGVKRLKKVVARIKKISDKNISNICFRTSKMKQHLLSINKILRSRTQEKREEVRKITTTMASIAKKAVAQVERMSNKLIPETENDQKMFSNLLDTTKKVTKVIEQTEKVNSGNAQISERIVSFCDPDARPIPKGKAGKKVEFGYKLQVMESECGIISGYQLYKGNPSDKTLMDDILQHHIKSFKKVPKTLALDRGYYDSSNEKKAFKAGIKNVCMPKQGKKSKARTQYENSRIFKRLKRWRAGIEGRISYLKRRFGLSRSMTRGYQNTQTWTGLGIFAHNLRQYAKLTIN